MNKNFITNFISLLLIVLGLFSPLYKEQILSVGFFAFSGAITNWIAIYMLFEKVPGLYGSGVIPSQFEEFKKGIKSLIMEQFFTNENLEKFFHDSSSGHENSFAKKIDFRPIVDSVDYDKIFADLLEVVQTSSLGGMLNMFGGVAVLGGLKEPFVEKMKSTLNDITHSENFLDALEKNMKPSSLNEEMISKIENIVNGRLEELTPQKVKEIVQDMIQKHLGWLVVWGGVLGGLIGLVMSFIKIA